MPTDVLFTGTRSFARLRPQPVTSVSLSLEAEVKPEKERGLIAFLDTPHFYTALSLQGGVLEYRWTGIKSLLTDVMLGQSAVQDVLRVARLRSQNQSIL